MKKTITFLLAALLLAGAAPATMAQEKQGLTTKQANQLLQRIVGSWTVNRYLSEPVTFALTEVKGSANCKKGGGAEFVHETTHLRQPNGTIESEDGFLRYAGDRERFEFVQPNKKGKNVVLMAGDWSPEYNTLVLRPVLKNGRWAKDTDPNMQYLYVFKPDGSFMKIVRTYDANVKSYRVISQDHYAYNGVAKS